MSDLIIGYNITELKYVEFPESIITEKLLERLVFNTIEEVRQEIHFNNVLNKIMHYTDPYRLECESIQMEGDDISIHIKVKDIHGASAPRLIPYKRGWFIVGTGPHSKEMDVEMVNDIEEYVSMFKRLFSGEHSFAYFCTLNENLEIIDWHSFYDFYDEENKNYVENAKKEILNKYSKYMKKVGDSFYICIVDD
jgi:hypothetical protein